MMKQLQNYAPGLMVWVIALIVSLCTYQDYGVSWDEPIQRTIGEVSYNYIFHQDPTLHTYIERDHGVGFELLLLGVEKLTGATDFRDIFLVRHLASNIFYLFACFAGYVLALRLFKNQGVAVLAFLLLVLHPRLYAHSFFNSKDTPLLATYLFAFLLAEWSFRTQKKGAFFLLGLVAGYATSIRILGIYLIVCMVGFLLFDIISNSKEQKTSTILRNLGLLLLGSFIGVYVFWPTLWVNPIGNFIESYQSLSHFRWEGTVLFNGVTYNSTAIPWFYLPGWFALTTPLVWMLFAAIGFCFIGVGFFRNPISFIRNNDTRNMMLYVLCFFGPVAAVIVLKSVVYDDWRHVYFIYPAMVMMAMYGLQQVSLRSKMLRNIGVVLVLIQVGVILQNMWAAHPFHQVYFNELVSDADEYRRKNYDGDYWGSSYKQALDYIIQQDKSDSIKVNLHSDPLINNVMFLPPTDRKRIVEADINHASYYIVNFRGHPQDYDFDSVFVNLKVANSTIVRAYKLR